jgi:hypothetical protein
MKWLQRTPALAPNLRVPVSASSISATTRRPEGAPATFNLYALCGGGGGRSGGWVCDGGSCGTSRTVTGASGVGSEGGGQAGVYTDQGLILTPN